MPTTDELITEALSAARSLSYNKSGEDVAKHTLHELCARIKSDKNRFKEIRLAAFEVKDAFYRAAKDPTVGKQFVAMSTLGRLIDLIEETENE